uniref:Uncharacterized protein n=1 Tax=Laticauda laticaudata TaxID=8630 RepID=A0A8C5SMP3_LATLA
NRYLLWVVLNLQQFCQEPAVTNQHVSKEFDWLISDRGPFHHSRSYLSFVERHRQGFTTRYKIYRVVFPPCRDKNSANASTVFKWDRIHGSKFKVTTLDLS